MSYSSIKVLTKEYDSRPKHSGHSYSFWTNGAAYDIFLDGEEYKASWLKYDDVTCYWGILYEDDHGNPWREISFSEIPRFFQSFLVEQMGEKFPWEASSFASYEEYDSIENKILRAISSKRSDFRGVFKFPKPDERFVRQDKAYERYGDKWIRVHIIRFGGEILLEEMDAERVDEVRKLLEEEEQKRAEEARKEAEELRRKKREYGRKCRRIANFYGVSFKVVAGNFKGDEEAVKLFTDSLWRALTYKEADLHELLCGRERVRRELDYLEIEYSEADPYYLGYYVFQCFERGTVIWD